ncbi:MAG: hypothetical protein H7256_09135 [Bdellovibrio sp.]|nr:hypothetical protein [Bdellovibrio sp.]
MKKIVTAALLLIGALGCGTKPINEKAQAVVLTTETPPSVCKEVGMASVTGVPPFYPESMRTKLKNEATLLGGNYVKTETVQGSAGTLNGTVYSCP